MNLKLKQTAITAITLIIVACNSTQDHSKTVEQNEKATHHHAASTTHDLVLNHGEKWEANRETTAGVKQLIHLTNTFSELENPTAYQALKTDLEKEFSLIFKRCTMQGEAHNQLHNFLFPMKAMFSELGSASLADQQMALDQLKVHLVLYQTYFE